MSGILTDIERYDRSNMLASIEALPSQFLAALSAFSASIPKSYRFPSSILVSGMGGSGLGAHIAYSLLRNELSVPYVMAREYGLPEFVNSKTLVFIISYSGNTEETLSTYKEARKRNANIIAITSGGKLGALAKAAKIPAYIFDPIFNPSSAPRMGLGYLLGAELAFLSSCGLLSISKENLHLAVQYLQKETERLSPRYPANPALKLAQKFKNSIPVLLGGEFLEGSLHAFTNQINENAKTFAAYFSLPEFNHHMLEGLQSPREIHRAVKFLALHSKLYTPALQESFSITEKILRAQRFTVLPHTLQSKSKLFQIFEMAALGSYVSFYLAILQKRDPTPIPWVSLFKSTMKKVAS
jgi:glucose/mannose-6-phosphate isomerase